MRVWIVAKAHYKHSALVHGLTEENQHIRLMRTNEFYPAEQNLFEVGQIWDLSLSWQKPLRMPYKENMVFQQAKPMTPETNLPALLRERVTPWQGPANKLFERKLRSTMDAHKPFIAHQDPLPLKSMGYWQPDIALSQCEGKDGHFYYLYKTEETEWLIQYAGFAPPLEVIPAQTLLHVALFPWWIPDNLYARTADSVVKERAYLYIAGWY